MNTCPRCGAPMKPLNSDQLVCDFCGGTDYIKRETPKVENFVQQQPVQQQPVIQREVVYVRNENNSIDEKLGCWMWGLCFMFPLVGLIAFFVYKSNDEHTKAQNAITAAIIGFIVGIIIYNTW